jgi:hypothetical protein
LGGAVVCWGRGLGYQTCSDGEARGSRCAVVEVARVLIKGLAPRSIRFCVCDAGGAQRLLQFCPAAIVEEANMCGEKFQKHA